MMQTTKLLCQMRRTSLKILKRIMGQTFQVKPYRTEPRMGACRCLAGGSFGISQAFHGKLRAAEALYTLVALKDPTFAVSLADQRQQAWIACGLYLSTTGPQTAASLPARKAAWQRKIAVQLIVM